MFYRPFYLLYQQDICMYVVGKNPYITSRPNYLLHYRQVVGILHVQSNCRQHRFTRDINSNVLAYCMYYLQYLQAICRQSLGKILQINHSIQISCRYFAYAVKLQAMYRLIVHITRNSRFTCKLLQKPVDCLLYYRATLKLYGICVLAIF